MKLLKLITAIALLAAAQTASAAAAIVQSSGKQTASATSLNPTFTLPGVVAGDAIIVVVNYLDLSNNSVFPTSVSDAGGTYTVDEQVKAANLNGSHTSANVYSFFNAASGSHTLTFTRGSGATSTNWYFDVLEVSGLPTTNSKDTSSTVNYGASTGPLNVGGSTLGAANGLSIVLSVNEAANNASAIYPPEIGMSGSGSSYTGLFTGSSDYPSGSAGYLIPSTTATLGADFGGISASNNWGVVSVYYTPATGGGTAPSGFFLTASTDARQSVSH